MIANMEENEIGAYPIVRARRLTKTFGDFTAVNDVDIDVPRGGCFGLLGPNGAGKTTTLRMILGQTHPSSGELQVLGQTMPESTREVRRRIGVVPQTDIYEVLQKMCPHWEYQEVADGGHMAPVTRPDLVNPIIVEFVRKVFEV